MAEFMMDTLRELGDNMPGGFFVYRADEEEEILYANDVMYGFFGCDGKEDFTELTGNTFHGLVYPEDLSEVQSSIINQVMNDRENHLDYVEYRIKRKDGVIRWVDDYGRLVDTEEFGKVYYVLIRDITEKYEAEQEKLRMRLELEREKHLSEVKNKFLFGVSHDFRTPMNSIKGFTDLAYRNLSDPETAKDYLEKVMESNTRMISLIDDLLEMSRLDQEGAELIEKECDLEKCIDSVMEMVQESIGEKTIYFEKYVEAPDGPVIIDETAMKRIMRGVLDNAVKFTPEGGAVHFSARKKGEPGSGFIPYEFVIVDTGIGMSREFMERMYDSFEREATSTESGYAGAGLGLSITKRLLDLMGGSIKVESNPGKGTRVVIVLPIRLAGYEGPSNSVDAAPAKAAGEYRILQAEDVKLNRLLVEQILKDSGFLVESVEDGSDAVRIIGEKPEYYYDFVLMDIQMPIMDGYEAARRIRAMGRRDTRDMPIVALSANARKEDRQESLAAGMNAYISKPFGSNELIDTINRYVKKQA